MVASGLDAQNDKMMKAFDGVYLIKVDVDEWGWGGVGFNVWAIPIFFRLDSAGDPTGDFIDGGAWGPDTIANITNTMDPWIHKNLK